MYVGMYVCVFTIIEIRRSPDTYLNLFQDRQCKLAKYLFYLHKRASTFLNIPSSATIIANLPRSRNPSERKRIQMSGQAKSGKLFKGTARLFPRFKTARSSPKASVAEGSISGSSEQVISEDPDTVRTQERYDKAAKVLKNALRVRRDDWKAFEFPELDKLSEKEDVAKLQAEINKVLEAREMTIKNKSNWGKCKGIVELVFTTLSPFAKNVLGVAINIQSVRILSGYIYRSDE